VLFKRHKSQTGLPQATILTVTAALAAGSVLFLFVACGHHYDDGGISPLHSNLMVVTPPNDVSLGQGFDSVHKHLTQFGCVSGTPVGRYRNSKSDSISPVSTVSINPTRDSVVEALTNLSRLSGWLNGSEAIKEFAGASAGTKKSLAAARMVVVRGEIFTLGKDEMRSFAAPNCADAFVSHLYAGAFFGVTINIEFKSAAAKRNFTERYGSSAPFGPGDHSDQLNEMSQDLAAQTENLSMTVIEMGGDVDATAGVLHRSTCAVTDLQSCSDTLADLLSTFNKSLSFPESQSRLNGFAIVDFATSGYDTIH
jgi:hypothetical protein